MPANRLALPPTSDERAKNRAEDEVTSHQWNVARMAAEIAISLSVEIRPDSEDVNYAIERASGL